VCTSLFNSLICLTFPGLGDNPFSFNINCNNYETPMHCWFANTNEYIILVFEEPFNYQGVPSVQIKTNKYILMKKTILILVFAVSTAMVFNACSGSSTEKTEQAAKVEYTCPMHDDVVQAEAGKCPKCGMDLVEKKVEEVQDSTKM
jgi:hypothetical protein